MRWGIISGRRNDFHYCPACGKKMVGNAPIRCGGGCGLRVESVPDAKASGRARPWSEEAENEAKPSGLVPAAVGIAVGTLFGAAMVVSAVTPSPHAPTPNVPCGHKHGRYGCTMKECLYGKPSVPRGTGNPDA
jgi:hypothetical protein